MLRRSLISLLVLGCSSLAHAETIIKFELGTAGADMQLTGGMLSTIDDGNVSTLGDQDTNVTYTGFLGGLPNIPGDLGSFSLTGVELDGPASVIGGMVFVQPTRGGEFHLWDDVNELILAGSLSESAISGTIGSAATGSFFNLEFDQFTDGYLLPLLKPDSMSLAISFTDVNDGAGFSVAGGTLAPFTGAVTGNIAAMAVPEPSTWGIFVTGGLTFFCLWRRQHARRETT